MPILLEVKIPITSAIWKKMTERKDHIEEKVTERKENVTEKSNRRASRRKKSYSKKTTQKEKVTFTEADSNRNNQSQN